MSAVAQPAQAAEPAFDPYYTWLGIPPNEQPPNHYRLLGITLFEANDDVISHAADRLMIHLRTFANGPRSRQSQQLLNEVASAQICLLDQAKKGIYDQNLRREMLGKSLTTLVASSKSTPQGNVSPASPVQPPRFESYPVATSAPPAARSSTTQTSSQAPTSAETYVPRTRRKAKPSSEASRLVFIVGGGVMGIAIGYFIAFVLIPMFTATTASVPPKNDQSKPSKSDIPSPLQSNVPTTPVQESGLKTESPSQPKALPPRPTPEREPNPPSTVDPTPEEPFPPSVQSKPFVPAKTTEPSVSSTASPPPQDPIITLPSTIDSATQDLDVRFPVGSQHELLLINISRKSEFEFDLMPLVGTADSRWTLIVRSSNPEDPAPRSIAQFIDSNDELTFRWLPDADDMDRLLLMGHLLRVSAGDMHQFFGFREPVQASSLRIDFDKKRDLQSWEVNPPPDTEYVEAQFDSLEGWPYGARYAEGKQTAKISRTVSIEFEELPGAQIEIKFISPRENALGLMTSPVFRENAASEVELTKVNLQEAITAYERAIPETRSRIAAASQDLSILQSTNRANLNAADQLRLAGGINQLQERIGRDERELAEAQARLAAAPKLNKFISDLDDKRTIGFRIVTTLSGDQPISIIDGSHAGNP